MDHLPSHPELSTAQRLAERAIATLERFLHVEAVSGVVLLGAAVIALIWANSPLGHTYQALWHMPLSVGFGSLAFSQSLHFWINDAVCSHCSFHFAAFPLRQVRFVNWFRRRRAFSFWGGSIAA